MFAWKLRVCFHTHYIICTNFTILGGSKSSDPVSGWITKLDRRDFGNDLHYEKHGMSIIESNIGVWDAWKEKYCLKETVNGASTCHRGLSSMNEGAWLKNYCYINSVENFNQCQICPTFWTVSTQTSVEHVVTAIF